MILLRLPAKQLVRFKAVSKHWNSLISDPQFCHLYSLMKLSCPPSGLFFGEIEFWEVILALLDDIPPNKGSSTVRFPFIDSFGVDCISAGSLLQTCNGLSLCCCCYCGEQDYYVCNFTTKQFNTLPRPSWIQDNHNMVLAFNPQNSPHYKTVFLTSDAGYEDGVSRIDIYSSETGLWKPAKHPLLDHSYWSGTKEKNFWDNVFYWLGHKDFWYFDMDEECMATAAVPSYTHKFGIFSGHLHLMTQQANAQGIDVYEMKKAPFGKPSWHLMHSIDLTPVRKAFPEINGKSNSDILRLAWGYNAVGWTLVLLEDGKVIIFNEKDKIAKLLLHLPAMNFSTNRDYDCYQHFETLFRV